MDDSPYQVDKKCTQSGRTETLILYAIGKAIQGLRIFYVWPTDVLLCSFVKERFDKTLLYTPYYQALSRVTKYQGQKKVDSAHMKDVGSGNICFVPSNSESSFTSYPADIVIIDELDECNQDNIKMARERLDHSNYRYQIKVANPKFNGMGIDEEFTNTDQKEWGIKCGCGKWIFLDWFQHIIRKGDAGDFEIIDSDWSMESERDIYPICDKCGRTIDRRSDGVWVPQYPGRRKSGRHTSKLFAGTSPLYELVGNYSDGLKDDQKMQRFYNADLGLAYTAAGSKITTEDIFKCIGEYAPGKDEGLIIAGVDVGKYYHYVIKRVLPDGKFKTLIIGKTMDTEALISTLKEYNVKVGVIDALPETREARKICNRMGLMFMCFFGGTKGDTTNLERKMITVQRTPALDAVKEAILTQAIEYPYNIKGDKEFLAHMTASVRAFNEKREVYEWVEGNQEDHYFLATAYCLMAKRLILLLNR